MKELGAPANLVEWLVLGAALLSAVLGLAWHRRLARVALARPTLTVAVLALAAALLSWGYLAHYLRGGPRVIDATSYWLEGRALSGGQLAFPIAEPVGSFRGRFLLPAPGAASLAVLFPPGYPALLALGFLLGAPLAMGPLLAALLVAVTFGLGRKLFGRDDLALVAALLSVCCAALRYHTADTMSHGLAAVLFAGALWAALSGGKRVLLAGLAVGWLAATRPVNGLVALLFVSLVLAKQPRVGFALLGLGMIPGVVLMLLHQHAATGAWLGSAQLRYYALADGPPGCFRYGFGAGVGCEFEHGDFVRAAIGDSYGLVAALGTTGRRLWLHATDIINAWPLALVVPWVLWAGRREPAVRLLGAAVVAQIAAYLPYYFDGNYPGGGARLFAEALPLEHLLLASGLVRLKLARFGPAAALAGFAMFSGRLHTALAEREGGAPMFRPEHLERERVSSGLVFISTDHGFNLAHRPGQLDAKTGLVVARLRNDAHDWLLFEQLGRPPTFRYQRDLVTPGARPGGLERFEPPRTGRFDGGALWPPTRVSAGWAHPDYPADACAAGAFALRFRGAPTRLVVELGAAEAGRQRIVPRWVSASGQVAAQAKVRGITWAIERPATGAPCFEAPSPVVELPAGGFPLELEVQTPGLALASVEVLPASPEPFRKSVDN